MNFTIYKLHFTEPLHINYMRGDTSISQRTIQSDTLYAALISSLAKIGEMKATADGDLGCTISSLFPYCQELEEDEATFFLPMPYQARLPKLKDASLAKKVKKVQWVDHTLYGRILGEKHGEHIFDNDSDYIKNIWKSFLIAPKEKPFNDFFTSSVTVRTSIPDRTGNSHSMPFYVDRVFFKGHSGLYFLVDGKTDLIEKGLDVLKDEGVGTDRNVGYGAFEYEKDSIDIDCPTFGTTPFYLSLSVLIPENEKQLTSLLDSENVAYELVRRGGWITTYPYTTLRKNAIYAFLPGSVFSNKEKNDQKTIGRIVDLTPDMEINHKIWRSGRSIVLPIIP